MSTKILDVAQGSPAWHSARVRRYGATTIGMLTGVSAHGGPAEVWQGKLGRPPPFALGDLWSDAAIALEPVALRAWQRETGTETERGPVLVETDGWRLASLDAWTAGREPLDVKVRTRSSTEWDLWADGTIPEDVALQLDQQAALTADLTGRSVDVAHVAAILVSGFAFEFRAYRLDLAARREQYRAIVADLPIWHATYVIPRIPPPDATYRHVAAVVDVARVKRRDATDAEAALLAAWAEKEREVSAARQALKAAESARDVPKSDLARSMGVGYLIPGTSWTTHAKPQLRLTDTKE